MFTNLEDLLERIQNLEAEIVDCQKSIDEARTLYPYDCVIQGVLDSKQAQLDRQKNEVRGLKQIANAISN